MLTSNDDDDDEALGLEPRKSWPYVYKNSCVIQSRGTLARWEQCILGMLENMLRLFGASESNLNVVLLFGGEETHQLRRLAG